MVRTSPTNANNNTTPAGGKNVKEIVRKGKGITGISVAGISPHISGRLTLGMREKMQHARHQDA